MKSRRRALTTVSKLVLYASVRTGAIKCIDSSTDIVISFVGNVKLVTPKCKVVVL